ncbi:hypothetical protein HID58_064350, partial [Brassica napus]
QNIPEGEKLIKMTMSENQRNLEAGLLLNKNRNDINECRITVAVLFSTFVAVCGSFCFGCAAGYSSMAQTGIINDLGLSVAQYSMFGSSMTFGGMFGAIFSGKVADLIGRKGTMWFGQVFCIAGWLAIAFAQNTIWLDAGRFSTGFAVGLFSYVLMQSCGCSLFYVIGNFIHWRNLALIGLIPCILQVVTLFIIPESPRLLGKWGREKECRASLQLLRGDDADVSEEANTIKETMALFDQGPKSRVMDLFQRRYAPSLVIGVGLMLLQQLSGSSGIMFYVGSVFDKGGFPKSIGSMILAVIMIPKSILGVILVEKMGRRPLLLVSTTGMCLFSLFLAFSFSFRSYGMLDELTPIFTCIGVVGFLSSFAIGMGGLPWIIMSEIFPMNVKVSAGTLVTLANWSFSWIVAFAYNFMIEWNASGTFLIFFSICAAGIAFIYAMVPETKGRTLEDIQASLTDFRQTSMEKGLLNKSLSIRERERKFRNEDVFLETGLSRKSPRELIKKAQDDDGECRVTASVFLSTFVAYSMFGSILTLGGLIGAIFSGKVADVLGRKRMMLFCEAFCVTGWLAIALAKDALWLDCGRLLLGIGIGLFSYVIPVYVAEIAPKHVRGSFVFANQLMQNCGIALFFIIGNFVPWRLLAIVGFVPCVLHVSCIFFIPESPRWLAKKGRDKDCRTALQCLRGPDVDISREANTIRDTIEMSEVDGETRMSELFRRRYAYPLFIGVGLMFLQQLSGSAGVTYYASSLFQKGGFPSAVGTSVIATMMVPKAMLGTIIVDKLGRRTLLMASCAAMGLSALLLSVSYGFQSFGILPDLTPIFTCIGVLGHTVTFALGMGGLPWIIMAEIFPMNVKVSAGTLVTVTNWLFGWIVTYTFNFMLEWNASGMFFIFSMVSAFSIVFVYFLVPETKGRSLEEIQALFSNSVQ